MVDNKNIKDGLNSHSVNTVIITKVKKDIPFAGYHYNRPHVVTSTYADTCTHEEFADDLDTNVIINKYRTLNMPLPTLDKAIYGVDVPTDDFSELANRLNSAQQNFLQLPADFRALFDNDVKQFAKYLSSTSDEDINKLLKQHKVFKEVDTPSVDNQPTVDTSISNDKIEALETIYPAQNS